MNSHGWALPRDERYVFDGKYVTSAGVSAGIDMALALALAAKIAGDEAARAAQLVGPMTSLQPPISGLTVTAAGSQSSESGESRSP
jgi:transcriptional regulator GlxA family with amidase domain